MSLTDFVIMPGADYQDACDAIREKTGGADAIKSGDLGAAIRGIYPNAPYAGYAMAVDGLNGTIDDSVVMVYDNMEDWANGNNRWTYCGILTNPDSSGYYSVKKVLSMPIEIIQTEKGDSSYIPTADEFIELCSRYFGTGDIILSAHNYNDNTQAWMMQEDAGVLVQITGIDFENYVSGGGQAHILVPLADA